MIGSFSGLNHKSINYKVIIYKQCGAPCCCSLVWFAQYCGKSGTVIVIVRDYKCKFGGFLCKLTSQYGLAEFDILLKVSPNYVF